MDKLSRLGFGSKLMGVYLIIFAVKLVSYLMSGVMALLAEALHTLSDIFVSGFLLIGAIYSLSTIFGYHSGNSTELNRSL